MKKIIFLILLLPFFANAQVIIKGSLTGYGPNQIIEYYQPIGLFVTTNRNMVTYKVNKDSTFYLKLDIKQQMFITIKIAGERSYLLVKAGDVITMDLKRTADPSKYLKISGSNASANSWYNRYTYDAFVEYAPLDSLINLHKTMGPQGAFRSIKSFITKQYAPIDSLFNRGEIDKKSFLLFKREVTVSQADQLILKLNTLSNKYSEDHIIQNNIATIKDSIYKNYPPLDPDNLKLISGDGYLLSSNVRDFIKNPAKPNPADTVFGAYNQYLLLPPQFSEYQLGGALMVQKAYSADEFNFEKGYAVFKRKFPDSKFIPLLEAYIKEDKTLAAANNPDIIIDTVSNFKTVQDIVTHYKGQSIFIDLWATWCSPCKQEFPYYKNLEADFKKRGVKLIFISIDNPKMQNFWKKVILTSNLKGTHYIANKALMDDIQNRVYDYKPVSIPRYLLYNKNGELVNGDAPRPSNGGELITLFDNKL